ncbi:conserved hypothetical protein [Frankia sp. Hr75.2]|nr:conserved hypothetical protein [Frankia sp. Hr75.2]
MAGDTGRARRHTSGPPRGHFDHEDEATEPAPPNGTTADADGIIGPPARPGATMSGDTATPSGIAGVLDGTNGLAGRSAGATEPARPREATGPREVAAPAAAGAARGSVRRRPIAMRPTHTQKTGASSLLDTRERPGRPVGSDRPDPATDRQADRGRR